MGRSKLVGLASVGTVAVAVAILGGVGLVGLNLHLWLGSVLDRMEITAFLHRRVDSDQAQRLRTETSALPEAASVRLITREQAWEELKRNYPYAGLEGLANPLPDALLIRASRPDQARRLAAHLRERPEVDQVRDNTGVRESLLAAWRVVRYGGAAAALLALLGAVVVIHNSTMLTIYSRRREISIMQMVGAGNWAIAGPFVLSGACYGVVGSLVGAGITAGGYLYLRQLAALKLRFLMPLLPPQMLLPVEAALAGVGVLIGITGSSISIAWFLRRRAQQE